MTSFPGRRPSSSATASSSDSENVAAMDVGEEKAEGGEVTPAAAVEVVEVAAEVHATADSAVGDTDAVAEAAGGGDGGASLPSDLDGDPLAGGPDSNLYESAAAAGGGLDSPCWGRSPTRSPHVNANGEWTAPCSPETRDLLRTTPERIRQEQEVLECNTSHGDNPV